MQTIDRSPVASSQVAAVGYSADEQLLEVEFKSGGIYRYDGVTHEGYLALVSAPSIGSHLGKVIKPAHPCSKLNPETGAFEPIVPKPASDKQLELLRVLAKKAGWWTGSPDDPINAFWHALPVPAFLFRSGTTVADFLARLTVDQASACIEHLKS